MYAVVSNGRVIGMAGDVPLEIPDGVQYIDVTGMSPMPDIGWTYDEAGATFSQPAELRNGEILRSRLPQAVAANKAFLALSPPTQAQVVSQVNALTRQVNGLMRLAGQILDDTT